MSIDQESTAGPSHRNEGQEQVQRLLAYIEGWVNFPEIMLEEGVLQRSQILLARLRMHVADVEAM